jgi:ABC-type sugar transport system permease subunit
MRLKTAGTPTSGSAPSNPCESRARFGFKETAVIDRTLLYLDALLERVATPRRQWPAAIVFLLPALVVLALFHFLPILSALRLSLTGGRHGQGSYVGVANYAELAGSATFWNSARVTLFYAAGVVPSGIAIALCIALLLHRLPRGQAPLRTCFFLPYVTSITAAAMVWRILYNGQTGLLNTLLERAGLPPQQWLLEPRGLLHILSGGHFDAGTGPSLALCSIMLFDVWHGSGFLILVLLAGLAAVPRELEEVARLEGATALQVARHITVPLLSPTLLFLGIIGVAGAFQAFTSFYALAPGGGQALGSTENLMMHLYVSFYEYGYWGYGCAVAVVLSAVLVVLTLVQWRLSRRHIFHR